MSEGASTRKIYERHLDLLLAEELACRPAFAFWFLSLCDFGAALPDEEPETVVVEISRINDGGDVPSAAGEDDLFVEATWRDGTVARLLVEDKLDAVLQERQIERYEQRIAVHRADIKLAGGAVVAPADYLSARSEELAPLAQISVESVASRLRDDAASASDEVARRLLWRAGQLVQMKARRTEPSATHEPTVALNNWLQARITDQEPTAQPGRMRTAKSTWLAFFNEPSLLYKIDQGVVDIYPAEIWPDDRQRVEVLKESQVVPDGFSHSLDKGKKNAVIRCNVHEQLDVPNLWSEAGIAHESDLLSGVAAIVRALRWLRAVQDQAAEAPRIGSERKLATSEWRSHISSGTNGALIRSMLEAIEAAGSAISVPETSTRGDYLDVQFPAPSTRRSRVCSIHIQTGRVEFQIGSWSRLRHRDGFDRLDAGDKAARSPKTEADVAAILDAFRNEVAFSR